LNSVLESRSFDYAGKASELLDLFKEEPYVFLLESSLSKNSLGRYSFVGFDPFKIIKCKGKEAFARLREEYLKYSFNKVSAKQQKCFPFSSGIVGYLSYDLGLPMEDIKRVTKKDSTIPESLFGFYDTVITIDHLKRKLIITSTGLPERNISKRRKRAKARIKQVVDKIERICFSKSKKIFFKKENGSKGKLLLKSNFTKKKYLTIIEKALNYISQGDIYQVNLSQQFCLDVRSFLKKIDSTVLYHQLRKLSPSCFSAYFDCRNFQIVSSSPELFLRVKDSFVQTRPMKGTRPRGRNKNEDKRKEYDLLRSRKDRAELLMITDLERNDLGRVCQPGSISVKEMRTLEKYKTVFQTTSTVQGKLRKDKDCFDLLAASFPGGSITGCPKIRAMQIIEELEPTARSIYTGSLGYVGFDGNMDFNILIRTLLIKDKKIIFNVGGGIVSDSSPEDEYTETLIKAKAMQDCLTQVFHRQLK